MPHKHRQAIPSHRHARHPRADNLALLKDARHDAACLDREEREQALQPMRAAFESFRRGEGSAEHLAHLVDLANFGRELSRRGIVSSHLHVFEAALAALVGLLQRRAVDQAMSRGTSWTLRGPEIAALEDALFFYGVQLQHASRRELRQAYRRVHAQAEQALRGNAGAGAQIFSAL